MGELTLLWPEATARCPARIAGYIEIRDPHFKPGTRVQRVRGRTCNLPATCDKWCELHAYKAEILRVGEVAGWPACSVNQHLEIGKGRESWEAFAEICSKARYEEFKPVLREIERTYITGKSYLHPLAVIWQVELEAQ